VHEVVFGNQLPLYLDEDLEDGQPAIAEHGWGSVDAKLAPAKIHLHLTTYVG
jgi:hypothetical protein